MVEANLLKSLDGIIIGGNHAEILIYLKLLGQLAITGSTKESLIGVCDFIRIYYDFRNNHNMLYGSDQRVFSLFTYASFRNKVSYNLLRITSVMFQHQTTRRRNAKVFCTGSSQSALINARNISC